MSDLNIEPRTFDTIALPRKERIEGTLSAMRGPTKDQGPTLTLGARALAGLGSLQSALKGLQAALADPTGPEAERVGKLNPAIAKHLTTEEGRSYLRGYITCGSALLDLIVTNARSRDG